MFDIHRRENVRRGGVVFPIAQFTGRVSRGPLGSAKREGAPLKTDSVLSTLRARDVESARPGRFPVGRGGAEIGREVAERKHAECQ